MAAGAAGPWLVAAVQLAVLATVQLVAAVFATVQLAAAVQVAGIYNQLYTSGCRYLIC